MTITFRVKDEAATPVMPLHLTTLRVAAMRKLLGQHAARHDDDYIFPIHGTPDTSVYAFEARVYLIPLAELSRVFYHYEPAIALFDEAQYHRRRVRISRSARHANPILDIAASSDNAPQLAMTDVHAYALLKPSVYDPTATARFPSPTCANGLSIPPSASAAMQTREGSGSSCRRLTRWPPSRLPREPSP